MRLWPRRRVEETTGDDIPGLIPGLSVDSVLYGVGWSPRLADRVWVANRCLQMCSQMLASMPLRFYGTGVPPAWVANPDPVWYPGGIVDAVFAVTWHQLSYGDAFLYITGRYANGYPSAWTVLDPATMNVQQEGGRRTYRSQQIDLDPDNVVQISRDPRGGLRGTSALASYATTAWGLTSTGELARTMSSGGGVPNAVLKSSQRLTKDQAEALQDQWIAARLRAGVGAPAVLPPTISFEQLSFNAEDLALLDHQAFDAKVIASAFGVPAMLLNLELSGGLTYQNPTQLYETWWRAELRHIARRIEAHLSNEMLPAGNYVEFSSRAVLAPSFQEQVTSGLAMLAQGAITTNEFRATYLHLPPLEQGEALDELKPPTASTSPAQQPANVVPIQAARTEPPPAPQVTFAAGAIQTPPVIVKPAEVHVDVHPGRTTRRTVTFSDGRVATIDEEEPANVHQ